MQVTPLRKTRLSSLVPDASALVAVSKSSKTLLQQNPPDLNWKYLLTQVVLYNGGSLLLLLLLLLLLHLYLFNSLFSWTIWVSWHQKGRPFWILLKQEMMEWQWHRLDHVQIICNSLQTDDHASTSPLSFYRPDTLSAAQPTASKHWRINGGSLAAYLIVDIGSQRVCVMGAVSLYSEASRGSRVYKVLRMIIPGWGESFECRQCFDAVGWTARRTPTRDRQMDTRLRHIAR